jgi:rod shape determining protein RodA
MKRRLAAFVTVICSLILSVIGIFLIYSASRRNFASALAVRQSIWILIGIAIFFAVNSIRRRRLYQFSWWCYSLGIGLLLLTFLFAPTIRGGRSWLNFWFFNFQASEIMKVFTLMALCSLSVKMEAGKIAKNYGIFLLSAVVLLPAGLVLMSGDTGTTLIYLTLLVCWFFILGIWKEGLALCSLGAGIVSGMFLMLLFPEYFAPFYDFIAKSPLIMPGLLVLLAAVLFFGFGLLPYLRGKRISKKGIAVLTVVCVFMGTWMVFFLKDYQRARLIAFVDPYQSPLKTGYNIIQSQIALGSGGWFGQGYLEGSQSQLGFVPELWTDFIFTVGVEELGLVFALFLLSLFVFLVYSAFSSSALTEEWWDYYFCAGVGTLWLAHSVVNLGVCVGLIPVMGLPLPFVSYGGSFMLTNWLMVGIIVSLSDRPRGLSHPGS